MLREHARHALVTGANGFIGRPLCRALLSRGFRVTAAVRSHATVEPGCERVVVSDLALPLDWAPHLAGVTTVFHLAAHVHRMGESRTSAEAANQAVNRQATASLAVQAFAADVRRFVLISSIKANGEATREAAFTPASEPRPEDAYGRAKLDAERAVQELAVQAGREYTIVRPPLVYGPGVRANFRSLIAAVARGIPLPLGLATTNRRSLIYVGNLVDCLLHISEAASAAQRVFLPSDGTPLSSAKLVREIGGALNRRVHLVPVPRFALLLAGKALGRTQMVRRLLDSLEVEDPFLLDEVGWRPPVGIEQAMRETCQWYLTQHPDQS
jgi:nucleoside-diphosphate-sugar epimerase